MFTACGIMRCRWPAASSVHYITSSKRSLVAPEDGRNYRPKHVELVEIINKLLLLHLVGCLHYCINDARSHKFHPLEKAVLGKKMEYKT